MSIHYDGGLGEDSTLSSAVVADNPCTLACWFNVDNDTAYHALLSVVDDAGANKNRMAIAADGADAGGNFMKATSKGGTVTASAVTTAQFTAGQWHHGCGVFASDTSRTVYLDGGNAVTSVVDNTAISGLEKTKVAAQVTSFSQTCIGKIAEAAIWDVALTAAEVALLARGYSPLCVRPNNLVMYMPLIRSSTVNRFGPVFTANGTPTAFAHPRIIYPRSRKVLIPAALSGMAGPLLRGGRLTHGRLIRGGVLI